MTGSGIDTPLAGRLSSEARYASTCLGAQLHASCSWGRTRLRLPGAAHARRLERSDVIWFRPGRATSSLGPCRCRLVLLTVSGSCTRSCWRRWRSQQAVASRPPSPTPVALGSSAVGMATRTGSTLNSRSRIRRGLVSGSSRGLSRGTQSYSTTFSNANLERSSSRLVTRESLRHGSRTRHTSLLSGTEPRGRRGRNRSRG